MLLCSRGGSTAVLLAYLSGRRGLQGQTWIIVCAACAGRAAISVLCTLRLQVTDRIRTLRKKPCSCWGDSFADSARMKTWTNCILSLVKGNDQEHKSVRAVTHGARPKGGSRRSFRDDTYPPDRAQTTRQASLSSGHEAWSLLRVISLPGVPRKNRAG
ncbi:hypothetical protein BC835DRAFT_155543 [Cytidiella melzeri]|nr:hypothetical protein BC835DRAFT_155543 [Cytidiella melzeri]